MPFIYNKEGVYTFVSSVIEEISHLVDMFRRKAEITIVSLSQKIIIKLLCPFTLAQITDIDTNDHSVVLTLDNGKQYIGDVSTFEQYNRV